jgi:hypothetical protein
LPLEILIQTLDTSFHQFKSFNDLIPVALVIFLAPSIILYIDREDVGVV